MNLRRPVESSKEKSKALKISFEADEKGKLLSGDRNKIRQVVSNLIDNSIKYTPEVYKSQSFQNYRKRKSLLKIEDST